MWNFQYFYTLLLKYFLHIEIWQKLILRVERQKKKKKKLGKNIKNYFFIVFYN